MIIFPSFVLFGKCSACERSVFCVRGFSLIVEKPFISGNLALDIELMLLISKGFGVEWKFFSKV